MLPADERASDALADLIACRRDVLARDDAWENCSEDQRDIAWIELEHVQNEILQLDFSVLALRLAGMTLLLDGCDQPNFADDFKNLLFEALRLATLGQAGGS